MRSLNSFIYFFRRLVFVFTAFHALTFFLIVTGKAVSAKPVSLIIVDIRSGLKPLFSILFRFFCIDIYRLRIIRCIFDKTFWIIRPCDLSLLRWKYCFWNFQIHRRQQKALSLVVLKGFSTCFTWLVLLKNLIVDWAL